jgi:hypothetical protein
MSFQKIVTYSTALIFTCATSLFIDAQKNQALALSDRCLTSVNEVTMTLNKGNERIKSGAEVYFPERTDVENQWVNAPYGNVMTFGHNIDVSEKYMKKASTTIIDNCKGTVAVSFSSALGEDVSTYGVVKGKVVRFKHSGCADDNSIVQGAFNRYGKIKWGYQHTFC